MFIQKCERSKESHFRGFEKIDNVGYIMSDLILSKLFRRQIKIIAANDQQKFLDICDNWDKAHKIVDSKNFPFSKITFKSQVKSRQLYLTYDFDKRKKKFWVLEIFIKTSKGFRPYKP